MRRGGHHSAATRAKISASLKLYHRKRHHSRVQAAYKANPTKANARAYDRSARSVDKAFKQKWAPLPHAMTEGQYLRAVKRAQGAKTKKTKFNDFYNE